MSEKNIYEHLSFVQRSIKAPKERVNKHQGFNYRNAEDIVEAVKAVIPEGCALTMSDEISLCGDRFYVKSTATFHYGDSVIISNGFAREPTEEKTRSACQTTGCSSSYARRYALCGLFAIDNSDEIDGEDNRNYQHAPAPKVVSTEQLLDLSELIHATKYDVKKLLSRFNKLKLNDFTEQEFEFCMNNLKKLQNMEYAKV